MTSFICDFESKETTYNVTSSWTQTTNPAEGLSISWVENISLPWKPDAVRGWMYMDNNHAGGNQAQLVYGIRSNIFEDDGALMTRSNFGFDFSQFPITLQKAVDFTRSVPVTFTLVMLSATVIGADRWVPVSTANGYTGTGMFNVGVNLEFVKYKK